MKHVASHSLPVSNGYGAGTRYEDGKVIRERPRVWCGRCKDYFYIDSEWVANYLRTVEHRVFSRVGTEWGVKTQEEAQAVVDEYVEELSRWARTDDDVEVC